MIYQINRIITLILVCCQVILTKNPVALSQTEIVHITIGEDICLLLNSCEKSLSDQEFCLFSIYCFKQRM